MPAVPIHLRDSVSAGFVQGILAGLQYRPHEALALLEHAGIASAAQTDASLRVPLAAYTRLYQLVSEHLGDEGFGLLSRPLRSGCVAWLLLGLGTAGTLGEALERMVRFFNLLQDNLTLSLDTTPTTASLKFTVTQPLPVGEAGFVFAHEWLLRLLHGIAAWLVNDPLTLTEVQFPYAAPAHAGDYERVFAAKVSFGGTALRANLPAQALLLPVRRDAQAVSQFVRQMPANITMLYRGERALAPQIRQQLRLTVAELPDLKTIARLLNLSPRTLHRRLEAEGTSLRRLRESVRHELAVEWLGRTTRPVQRIATDLGFADNTSFYRAFSQWEGCGPRDWRNRQHSGKVGDSELSH
jgi:AraC-like DNA-binding protein